MSVSENQANKLAVLDYWNILDEWAPGSRIAHACLDENVSWHGPDPVGDISGAANVFAEFWGPFRQSFCDVERDTHLFFGGKSSGRIDGTGDGEMWVTGTGNLHAIFERDYLSIPANGQPVSIRWGEFCRMREAKIVEVYFLIDLVDLIEQTGLQVLPPGRGAGGMYPPPNAGDGVLLHELDEMASAHSLQHIRRFIFDGLNRYDRSNLESMGMADFFHPQVRWYGPGGIGACLNFQEFETLHQQPWLHAFPDRAVQDLDALFAEGAYSGAPGWAGVRATHTGTYLDCPASGKSVQINGLDWWKRDGDVYIENWVFVDMLHLFRQFGVDLLARIRLD